MKLLLVFVSALLLVAQGKAAPANEEPQPEVAAVEVGAEQGEEAPGVLVYDAEEEPQIAYDAEDHAAEYNLAPEIGVYVPITQRVCTNAACANVCRSLGFKNGICISLSTCWCSN